MDKQDRIHILDILRGFALIGIFVVNIHLMRGHDFLKVSYGMTPAYDGMDHTLSLITAIFFEGAFISLFTLLFGVGFSLFMSSAERKGFHAQHLFKRRMIGLLFIGLFHLFFLWLGDILTLYAISGFLLLLFYRMKVNTLWRTGAGFLVVFILMLFSRMLIPESFMLETKNAGEADLARAVSVYETAPSMEWFMFRLFSEAPDMLLSNLFLLPFTLGMFLIGLAFGKTGIFKDMKSAEPLFKRLFTGAGLISIPLIMILTMIYSGTLFSGPGQGYLIDGVSRLTGMALAFTYLSGLSLLVYHHRLPGLVIRNLSNMGRMALTNYLGQTVLALGLIYSFGLYNHMTYAEALLLVLIILIFQAVFSAFWLSRYKQGPLEGLWRSFTYRKTRPAPTAKNETLKDKKVNRTLIAGAAANLVMAGLAWYTYSVSNSEAILLDGNYSFIMFLGVLIALNISRIKARKTVTFPLGQFFYEALYSFIKGLMIFGVLIMAVATAVIRIIMYISGSEDQIPMLIPEPILNYALICAVICFSVSFLYFMQNKALDHSSMLLKTEQKATFIDGTLSLGIAGGILSLTIGESGGEGSFIPYLADSIFVLILASFLIKEPVKIIRESVIELAGGTLQDEEKRGFFENAVRSCISSNFDIEEIFLSKNGSKYIVIVYLTTSDVSYNKSEIRKGKENLLEVLHERFPYVSVDLIPEGKPEKRA